jgi:glycosyltransferase involved in cell wall biosynthesis
MASDIAASVIVCTRNRAHYLRDSLGALAAQQCDAPFEVIVIDNGSTDDTAHVLKAWCTADPRFRTAYEPRLGLSCGKNAGIKNSDAPLLLFTDDDTLVDQRWIQTYLELFARHDGELIIAGGTQIPIPHDLGPWPSWFDETALADVGMLQYGEERPLKTSEYVWGANMALPRRIFDHCGWWNEAVGPKGTDKRTFEDTEFQDRFRAAGGTVWFCPTAVIRHRIDRGAITPRKIWSTAFARGRNDFWKDNLHISRDESLVPKTRVSTGLIALIGSLCRWTWWALAFRMRQKKTFFEPGRRAAFAAGRALDSLRAGRQPARLYLAVGGFVFRVRHLLLRLSPDVI